MALDPAPGITPAIKEPALPDSALYGPAGAAVRAMEPYTEAHPAGILLHLLLGVGSIVGRGPHFEVEADKQRTNEFGLLVGESAVSKKGTAGGWAKQVLDVVADADWSRHHNGSGLATPQGVLHKLRDDVDPGNPFEHDKRLFILEKEFASVLRACDDLGLADALRLLWDSSRLEHMVKKDPMVVEEPHVSLIGHITAEEFHAKVSNVDLTNGLLNRFLIAWVYDTKDLPRGGRGYQPDEAAIEQITEAISELRITQRPLLYDFTPDADALWAAQYSKLKRQAKVGGVIGSMMARGPAHVLRLSMIYTILDRRVTISVDCLNAALALWDFCSASAAYLFNPVAQATTVNGSKPTFSTKPRRLLDAITASGTTGITRQEISKQVFGNNEKAADISNWLFEFEREGIIEHAMVKTGGRPAERYFLSGQSGS